MSTPVDSRNAFQRSPVVATAVLLSRAVLMDMREAILADAVDAEAFRKRRGAAWKHIHSMLKDENGEQDLAVISTILDLANQILSAAVPEPIFPHQEATDAEPR